MTYFRDRYQGVGAIAAAATAPISAPAPTIRIPTITSKSKLMLAVPEPMTVGKPTVIMPGVKVVRMAAQPDNILVRVPVRTATTPGIDVLREQKLFAGTESPTTRNPPTGPDLQIGTGIGTPNPQVKTETAVDQVLRENAAIVATPPPVRVLTAPVQYATPSGPLISIAPSKQPAPMVISTPVQAPIQVNPSAPKIPWLLIGGGVLAYLLLKD